MYDTSVNLYTKKYPWWGIDWCRLFKVNLMKMINVTAFIGSVSVFIHLISQEARY